MDPLAGHDRGRLGRGPRPRPARRGGHGHGRHQRRRRLHGPRRPWRAGAGDHLLVPVLGRRRPLPHRPHPHRPRARRARRPPPPGPGVVRLLRRAAGSTPTATWPGATSTSSSTWATTSTRTGAIRAAAPAATRPGQAVTLDGYRARHALYKSDPDLQALHARHPMVAVWDDHELAGGAWSGRRPRARPPPTTGRGPTGKAAAVRAYWEWMPLRPPDPAVPERVYRMQRWGDLADLALLDTRLIGRDEPVGRGQGVVVKLSDTGRSMLGADQREWLAAEMAASTARWRLVGSQVVVAPHPPGGGAAAQPRPVGRLPRGAGLAVRGAGRRPGRRAALPGGNVAVLSGDIHSSWANELPVGAEFVGPSVSSPSLRRHPGARRPTRAGGVGARVPVAEPPRAHGGAAPPRLRGGRRHPRAHPGRLVAPRHGDGPVAGRVLRRRLAAPLGPARPRAGRRPRRRPRRCARRRTPAACPGG